MLQPLAEAAAATYSELQSQLTSRQAITKEKLRQKLATAAYGEGVKQLSDLNDDTLTDGTASATSRASYCGQTTPTETKKTTIAGLLYCICAGESGDSTGNFKPCTNEQSGAKSAKEAMTDAATDLKALAGLFPAAPTAELVNPNDILKPLAAFMGKAKAKDKYVVFGTLTATGCSGSATSGLCVIYKTQTKEDAQTLQQAKWRTNLVDTAAMLTKQAAQAREIKRLTQKLENLKKQAFNLKPQLELWKKLTAVLMAAAPKDPTQSTPKPSKQRGNAKR
uniref:Variant surface glycoprotein 1125.2947 n=1 Tax=Trypanosoma brucei TaxID=5691 RepID=A0A1J0R900_9TRYP|nr:variant surface glycoprotein 1125.2947 [Trypanosoma brucei]